MRLQPVFDIAAICSAKGITDAIVCPGSRCAPLTLSFARHPGINTRTISDERSAGFIALGIAQQTQRTVVLICTSGTAAYNFAPAVAEAFYQRMPLLILTADRPVEWIGQWDGQTISQQKIYGDHVLRFYQLPQEYDHADAKWSIQRIINEAINITQGELCGPVHVNVPLREPLYTDNISFSNDIRIIEKIAARPTISLEALLAINSFKKILIVGGQHRLDADLVKALNEFTSKGNAAVIGDVISNLHPVTNVIRYSDTFLSTLDDDLKESLRPDLLITIGQSVISKNLKLFLRSFKPASHWHIDENSSEIIDPFQSMTSQIQISPESFFRLLTPMLQSGEARKKYSQAWIDIDQKASKITQDFFKEQSSGEFTFVHHLVRSLPDRSNLHLSNSMAVRYANFCGLEASEKDIQVYSNRGTSGIDGCTSTVVGHSISSSSLHLLITGDVAFFYDRNAFWNNYLTSNLRIVILNNHGGAIFNIIDGPGSMPEVDEYFVTRQNLTAKHLATEFNLEYTSVSSLENIDDILQDFFKPGSQPKILEFESGSKDAKDLFLRFKEKVKNIYAT